jgi:hypothetical protein
MVRGRTKPAASAKRPQRADLDRLVQEEPDISRQSANL